MSPFVAGIVVTYFPDEHLFARLESLIVQVGMAIVVDNGSPPEMQLRLSAWLERRQSKFIANSENLGLSAALNQGMNMAESLGFEWAVTLDQDSTPQPGMIAALLATATAAPNAERLAMVGSRIVEEKFPELAQRWLLPPKGFGGYRFVSCDSVDLFGVTMLITSGTLMSVSCWRKIDRFDERLFIDYVDTDICLRAKRAGYSLAVSAGAVLHHNLGAPVERSVAGKTLRASGHAHSRRYYMARNRILVWRRFACHFPHWAFFDGVITIKMLINALLLEPNRLSQLQAFLLGCLDGVYGRTGRSIRNL